MPILHDLCFVFRLALNWNSRSTFAYSFVQFIVLILHLVPGLGKSGVAVIRVSGTQSSDVISYMTNSLTLPPPKQANLKTVYDPETKEPLDKGIILWFPGKR